MGQVAPADASGVIGPHLFGHSTCYTRPQGRWRAQPWKHCEEDPRSGWFEPERHRPAGPGHESAMTRTEPEIRVSQLRALGLVVPSTEPPRSSATAARSIQAAYSARGQPCSRTSVR